MEFYSQLNSLQYLIVVFDSLCHLRLTNNNMRLNNVIDFIKILYNFLSQKLYKPLSVQ